MEKKVTILSVVRNLVKAGRVDYFRQMLESVQNQTYKNIEHIIVDGMSDDATLDLLENYKSKGWITYYTQQDSGPYDAMNKAIQKYADDYVILLHSDDYLYDENAVEMQMKYLEMTDSDYVTGDTVFVGKNGNERPSPSSFLTHYDNEYIFERNNNIYTFWADIPYNHEGMLMKKKVFEAVGYFSDEKIYGTSADFKFEFDLILKDLKHVHIPYNFLCFRTGGASSSPDPRFYNILQYMYSRFYFRDFGSDLTEYDRLRQRPDKLFVFGLKNYLLSLKLKNFDYEKCFDFLDKMQASKNTSNGNKNFHFFSTQHYRLLGLPFMKVKTDARGSKHYKLFWFLPVFKIKNDAKDSRTYKLFSFLPLFKVKSK